MKFTKKFYPQCFWQELFFEPKMFWTKKNYYAIIFWHSKFFLTPKFFQLEFFSLNHITWHLLKSKSKKFTQVIEANAAHFLLVWHKGIGQGQGSQITVDTNQLTLSLKSFNPRGIEPMSPCIAGGVITTTLLRLSDSVMYLSHGSFTCLEPAKCSRFTSGQNLYCTLFTSETQGQGTRARTAQVSQITVDTNQLELSFHPAFLHSLSISDVVNSHSQGLRGWEGLL